MKVRQILAIKGSALFTIRSEQTVGDAIDTMAQSDVGSLVVFQAHKMVGMLTFREVLKAISAVGGASRDTPVAAVMRADPISVTSDTDIDPLRRLMIDSHVRYMPVVDGETLTGVISFHDVARAILEEQTFENRMLKNYIHDVTV